MNHRQLFSGPAFKARAQAIIFAIVAALTSPLLHARAADASDDQPQLSCPGAKVAAHDRIELLVTPERDFVDTPITVRLTGLRAGQEVRLSATALDAADVEFSSHAIFKADSSGTVDTSRLAPISGSYSSIASSGLLWSMRADADQPFIHRLRWYEREVWVKAEGGEKLNIEKCVTRIYPWSRIANKSIELDGYIGDLWTPESDHDLPLVVVLGGFDPDKQQARSSLLAARGFAVLDVVYHGQDPLPQGLVGIPLEYVGKAIEWAGQQPGIDSGRVGIFGTSKGAEYALVLASKYPNIGAVAAWTPSSVVWNGISFSDLLPGSSWTYGGEDIPFIPAKFSFAGIWRMIKIMSGNSVSFLEVYSEGLNDQQEVQKASIEVENINGPILLVSGGDDKMWPAEIMSGMIIKRLEDNNFSHSFRHLNFEKVGHRFPWGQWPIGPLDSGGFIRGGELDASHAAGAEAWRATIKFFQTALQVKD